MSTGRTSGMRNDGKWDELGEFAGEFFEEFVETETRN